MSTAKKKRRSEDLRFIRYCDENQILDLDVHISALELVLGALVLADAQVTLVPLTLLLDPLLEVVLGTKILPRAGYDDGTTTDDLGHGKGDSSGCPIQHLTY